MMNYSLDDLKYLMSRLRDPKTGCAWDIEQTYKTIAPSTIEEAYEVVDAIENENLPQLKEELGDLLFQVVFYSQLALEEEQFNFDGIVNDLTEKLVRRHPHVFPDGNLRGAVVDIKSEADELVVSERWEELKQQEREQKGLRGVLDDVPLGLPALSRAAKLQKRASGVGFDWNNVSDVLDKVQEEIAELQQAIVNNDQDNIDEELGDLLFSVVNVSRHLNINPESSLRAASKKFERRFTAIEKILKAELLSFDQVSAEYLEQLWAKVKTSQLQ